MIDHVSLLGFRPCSVMPNFAEKVEVAVDALMAAPQRDVDENEFIDASRLVYDGVRDIRRAVLLNRVRAQLLRAANLIACCFQSVQIEILFFFMCVSNYCILTPTLLKCEKPLSEP